MTWALVDGFEVYGDKTSTESEVLAALIRRPDIVFVKSNQVGLGPTLVDNDGADGGLALRLDSGNSAVSTRIEYGLPSQYRQLMNSSVGDWVFGFRYQVPSNSPSGSDRVWALTYNNSGSTLATSITMSVANSGKDLEIAGRSHSGTASGVLQAGQWHYIEVHVKPTTASNGGHMDVYVDGSNVYSSGSVNQELTAFRLYGFTFYQSGDRTPIFDDVCVYVLDGTQHTSVIGSRKIVRLVPTADAGPNDWSPSTGTDNFTLINNVNPGADYVEASTDGDTDAYDLTQINASSVECLQVDAESVATSGTPHLHIGLDDGSSDEVDMGVVPTSNIVLRQIFSQTPSGVDWTPAAANNITATQKMTS